MDIIGNILHPVRELLRIRNQVALRITLTERPAVVDDDIVVAFSTIASVISRIICSLIFSPKVFQVLNPIGVVFAIMIFSPYVYMFI